MSKLITRSAEPEDADIIAEHEYIAGKSNAKISLYDLVFPGSKEESIACLKKLLLTNTRSWLHYSHYLVGIIEGEVVASLCGYNEAQSGAQKMIEALVEIGYGPEELLNIYERAASFYRVVPAHPDEAWVIEHVATSEEFRGLGLISDLLETIMKRGREQGFKKVELGMFIGNRPAQRAYEKVGFVLADQQIDSEFEQIFGVPGMVRMVRDL
jgi:RimJ/RimL family protein N-acetyltransferase